MSHSAAGPPSHPPPARMPLTPIRHKAGGRPMFAEAVDSAAAVAAADARDDEDGALHTHADEEGSSKDDERKLAQDDGSVEIAAAPFTTGAPVSPLMSGSGLSAAVSTSSAMSPEPASQRKRTFNDTAVGEGEAGAAAAAVEGAAAASAASRVRASAAITPLSAAAWPWYFTAAVAGWANDSYASFIPRVKTGAAAAAAAARGRRADYSPDGGNSDLPDVLDVDWWGLGAEPAPVLDEEEPLAVEQGEEQKQASGSASPSRGGSPVMADEDAHNSKRAKLSPSSASGPTPSPRTLPASNVNVLSSFGQDSFFSVSNAALGCCVLGVADGVGGWRDNGVDSGEISRALMRASRDIALKQCALALQTSRNNNAPVVPAALNPSDIMTRAYAHVKGSGEVEAGSTTACIVALTSTPITALTDFDAAKDVQRQRDLASGAAETAVALASAAASAVKDVATSLMHDIAAAVSMQSEDLVAASNGSEHVEVSIDSEAAASAMSDVHAVSAPISIPAASHSSPSSAGLLTTADASPEPVFPSAPPADSAAADVSAAAVTAMAADASPATAPAQDSVYLSAANLGDSGYLIMRRADDGTYRVIQASDLQRTGRTVKQLAVIPPEFHNQQYCDDSPTEAMLDAHRLQEGDLLVLASDGLWDNLIASEWSWSFIFGWRLVDDNADGAKSRKERMCDTIENIVATGVTRLHEMQEHEQAVKKTLHHDAVAAEAHKDVGEESKEPPATASHTSSGISSVTSSALSSTHISAAPSMMPSRCASSSALASITAAATADAEEDALRYAASGSSSSRSLMGEGELLHAEADASDMETGPHAQSPPPISPPNVPLDALMIDDARGVSPSQQLTAGSALPQSGGASSAAPSSSSTQSGDWDTLEVRCIAEALKTSAMRFMQQPGGKPDDLSIIVAKIKKRHA